MLKNVWNILTVSFSLLQFETLKKETNKHHMIIQHVAALRNCNARQNNWTNKETKPS